MLVKSYRKEFCRPPNPSAQHLRCAAYLDADISDALPYLNTVLKGHQYFNNPPSLTLKLPGKLVTLHAKEISINILKNEEEAESILAWLRQVINETWSNRETIKPSYEAPSKPRVLDILRLLPRSNCGRCGYPTCMVFAVQVSEGVCQLEACPFVDQVNNRTSKDPSKMGENAPVQGE